MKKISTYLPSLLITVFLVFGIIGSSLMIIADMNITEDKAKSLCKDKNVVSDISSRLDRYYRIKYNSTGIPADVYMDAITCDYIGSVVEEYIHAGFDSLDSGNKFSPETIINPELEKNIDDFFNNYADETGYWDGLEKAEEEKLREQFKSNLDTTKQAAYKNIGSNCDVFKLSSINEHGLLRKMNLGYSLRFKLTLAAVLYMLLMIVLLLIVNKKDKKNVFYWLGIASVIAGIMGIAPSVYLIRERWFDAFSIKQTDIFKVVTGALYSLTETFLAVSIAIVVVGIILLIVYSVFCGKKLPREETEYKK